MNRRSIKASFSFHVNQAMAVQRTAKLNTCADVECNGETVKVIPKDS